MVSSETRSIGVAIVPVFTAFVLFALVETMVGFPGAWVNLASFVLVAVLGYAVPQLYLARTDTSVSPSLRLRTIPLVFLIFGTGVSTSATMAERATVSAILVGSFLLLAVYEFRAGYLSTDTSGQTEKL